MVLFIDSEIVHDDIYIIYIILYVFWGWLKTWKLECSKESSGQHTASEGVSQSRRATGLAETTGAGRWVWSESGPTENPRRFH